MRFAWVVALAACGRVGFDARTDAARAADGTADVMPSDLVAWVPLDTTQFLEVISGIPGMCGGACPTPVVGHSGMAMHFDGSTMCLRFSDDGRFSQAPITISIWANEDNPLGLRECQVSKRIDVAGNPYNSWQLETTGTADQESFTTNDGTVGNDQLLANTVIQPGVWQHLVATFDGATETLYVDGVAVNSGSLSGIAYDTNPVIIGCDDNGGFGEHYQGALDELRIYKRALSQAEVQALP